MWDRSHHDISRITGNHEQTDLTYPEKYYPPERLISQKPPVCTYIIKVDELPVVPLPIQDILMMILYQHLKPDSCR